MSDTTDIVRKPVQTPYMRRDSVYNPEFLDAEHALARFAPLINSIVRNLYTWYRRYETEQDLEDLRSFVQTEFLCLHSRYDPAYGVDFPGYIKMHLGPRVRCYVARAHRHASLEMLTFTTDTGEDCLETIPDERAAQKLERIDALLSVPVDEIPNDRYRDIIRQIVAGVDIYTLATQYGVSVRSMGAMIDAAGKEARAIMLQQEYGKDEDEPDAIDGADASYVQLSFFDATGCESG